MKTITAVNLLLLAANGIVIRDDVVDSEYKGNESDYPAVFPMNPTGTKEKGECCATMITDRHAITAAHCFDYGEWESFPVDINGAEY